MTRPRILIFAYACEPGRGSEPGAGWAWSRMLAAWGDVTVITRANNRDPIEAALTDCPEREQIRFEYIDLPERYRRWKRGRRGIRLYYALWQAAAVRKGRSLARERPFDIVWHLTLANAWMGSLAPLVGGTFVYGPVGGGVSPPLRLLKVAGAKGAFYEIIRLSARGLARYMNPAARLAWRRAKLILTQNEETSAWLPRRVRRMTHVFPNVVFVDPLPVDKRSDAGIQTAVYAGNLLPSKGIMLALETLVDLPRWRLVVLGSGPDEGRLRAAAARLLVEDRIEFRGERPRPEVLRTVAREADVLLFPSLHEEAGWAVAEAVAMGVPAVCLDRGGPRALGAICVPPSGPQATVRALAEAVSRARRRDVIENAFSIEECRVRLGQLLEVRGILAAIS
jgi:glycosyltransferase involved in cell wall biosynthesis